MSLNSIDRKKQRTLSNTLRHLRYLPCAKELLESNGVWTHARYEELAKPYTDKRNGKTVIANVYQTVTGATPKGMKEVARIKNNFAKPSQTGYSDINANIKLSNGVIVELQVNTTANMVAKERYGHALFEVWRSIRGNPKYQQLADVMVTAQKSVYSLSNKYSEKGTFPTNDIPKEQEGILNIFDKDYKHEPFAAAIRENVKKALPLYRQAKADGVLNSEIIDHFERLIEYVR